MTAQDAMIDTVANQSPTEAGLMFSAVKWLKSN